MNDEDSVARAIDLACRREYGRIVAVLTRVLGTIDEAEDVVQSAFHRALCVWPSRGIPDNPAAWLTTVSRRIALDELRRRRRKHERTADIDGEPSTGGPDPYELLHRWPDERLQLIFACSHPALDAHLRLALTLKIVCGLSTASVAAAFLVGEKTMAQRLVRAKRKLRSKSIEFDPPSPTQLPERIGDVLAVIYLLFNEGYLPQKGPDLIIEDLCKEALYLCGVVLDLLPDDADTIVVAETLGLFSFLRFTHSRRRARIDGAGLAIPLDEQDRSLWIHKEVAEAYAALFRANALESPGPYQVKAAIAATHHAAADAQDTDWNRIHRLYDTLEEYEPTSVVQLNKTVALGMSAGPEAALGALDQFDAQTVAELANYTGYYLARAYFYEKLGRVSESRAAYKRARDLSENASEQAFIDKRCTDLRPRCDAGPSSDVD